MLKAFAGLTGLKLNAKTAIEWHQYLSSAETGSPVASGDDGMGETHMERALLLVDASGNVDLIRFQLERKWPTQATYLRAAFTTS